MDCCDRGYDRPSLRAVGSTSRKPGVLACSFGYAQDKLALQGTVQVRFAPPPCNDPVARQPRLAHMAGRHTLLHDLERAIRAISGLAGFLYLGLGVFMQNTDQGP
jgi:hypothetical protein